MSHARIAGPALVATMFLLASCGSSSKSTASSAAPTQSGAAQTQSSAASTSTAPNTVTSKNVATHAATPAEAQIAASANAICQRLEAGITTAIESVPTAHTKGDINRAEIDQVTLRRSIVEKTAIAELRKLRPPQSLARDLHTLISAKEALAKKMTALGELASLHNISAADAVIASITPIQSRLKTIVTRDGIASCGQLQ